MNDYPTVSWPMFHALARHCDCGLVGRPSTATSMASRCCTAGPCDNESVLFCYGLTPLPLRRVSGRYAHRHPLARTSHSLDSCRWSTAHLNRSTYLQLRCRLLGTRYTSISYLCTNTTVVTVLKEGSCPSPSPRDSYLTHQQPDASSRAHSKYILNSPGRQNVVATCR